MLEFRNLRNKWVQDRITTNLPAKDEEISLFQIANNVVLPKDLVDYLKSLNGTGQDYTNDLYEFYSLDRIKNVNEEFNDWKGIPDYKKLSLVLKDSMKLFVLANYQFNLFAYAIRLDSDSSIENSVFVICGDEFKKIAKSFSDFILLYLNDSIELQFNK